MLLLRRMPHLRPPRDSDPSLQAFDDLQVFLDQRWPELSCFCSYALGLEACLPCMLQCRGVYDSALTVVEDRTPIPLCTGCDYL